MEVYHASTVVVDHPDTAHTRAYLDFGPGFYVTTLPEQARNYGNRFIRRGKTAILNTYEMTEDISRWKVIKFTSYNEEKPNSQICIRSQQALDECLTFKTSQRL